MAYDSVLGTNPFPPEHPKHKDWETASRLAQEEWLRFAADHLGKQPPESQSEDVHIGWEIDAFVRRFDIRAKAYCDLIVTSYKLADLYSREWLPAAVKETLALVRPVQAGNAYFLSELAIRLAQREFFWSGQALGYAREAEREPAQSDVPKADDGAGKPPGEDESPGLASTPGEANLPEAQEKTVVIEPSEEVPTFREAGRAPNETKPGKACKPIVTRSPTEWEEIELSFIGDHDVEVRVAGSKARKVNYREIAGFEDRRNGKPSKEWAMLVLFGTFPDGTMPESARNGSDWMSIRKTVERMSKALRKYFAITSDPFPYTKDTGYHARIKIGSAPH
jgi:hypothetical protein